MKKIILIIIFIIFYINNIKADINPKWEKICNDIPLRTSVDGYNILFYNYNFQLELSTDNGKTWKIFTDFTVFWDEFEYDFLIKNNIIIFKADDPRNVFISTNLGLSWNKLTASNGYKDPGIVIYVIAYNYEKLFIGTDGDLYISSDSGQNWITYKEDSTGHHLDLNKPWTADAIFFKDSLTFIHDTRYIWKSTDSMKTWKKLVNIDNLDNVSQLIYVGTNILVASNLFSDDRLSFTSDEGLTWDKDIRSKCCKSSNVHDIKACGDIPYIAADSGIFYSKDYGFNWEYINAPPNGYQGIITLAFNDDYIIVGTSTGLYRAPLKDCMIDTTETSVQEPAVEQALSISPNPASDILKITGNINNYPIKIYNIEGIKQIEAENTKEIDISKLPQGVYYIQIGNYFTKFVKI